MFDRTNLKKKDTIEILGNIKRLDKVIKLEDVQRRKLIKDILDGKYK